VETWQLVIFASALVLLALIAWVIVRDANRNAPTHHRTHEELQATGNELSPRERERKRRAARQRTKAQRRARRANRPR
jgi:uncharacterized membrane-anchored protein YhcB (DUF1043 family)